MSSKLKNWMHVARLVYRIMCFQTSTVVIITNNKMYRTWLKDNKIFVYGCELQLKFRYVDTKLLFFINIRNIRKDRQWMCLRIEHPLV